MREITVGEAKQFTADQFDQWLAQRERKMLLERTVEQRELEALEAHARIMCGDS